MKSKSVFSKKIASFILSLSIIAGTLACLSTSYVSAVTETPTEDLKPGVLSKTTYDFDTEVPTYTVKKPWNMGSSAVSVATDPDQSDNKVLEIKVIKNANKSMGVDFNYELESNTAYKISYRYKSDGNFNMPYEFSTYYQSGFFPNTLVNNEGTLGDSANKQYPVAERLAKFRDGTGNETISSSWTEVTRTFTTGTVDESKKYLSLVIHSAINSSVDYSSLYLDDLVIEKVNPNATTYDFDTEVPTYTVKKPWNMGSSAVSVATDPDQSDNKVLEIKVIKNANKSMGVDFNYELESNTAYKISYRYKSDGNFKMPGEADTYQQSGFFPDTLANQEGAFDSNANKFYPIAEKLTKFRDGTGNETISSTWTQVTRTFTTGIVDESKKYLSLVIHSAKNTNVEYSSLYLDDIVIEKLVQVSFDTNGGEAIDTITAESEKNFTLPTPNKFGYTFKGWFSDSTLTNYKGAAGQEITCPAENTTYYAKWILVGDVDENGKIENSDFVMLKKILLDIETDYNLELTDCSVDGSVNILDLVALKKILMTASV